MREYFDAVIGPVMIAVCGLALAWADRFLRRWAAKKDAQSKPQPPFLVGTTKKLVSKKPDAGSSRE